MSYKESFEITPPPPVNPETIKERVDTDIVVVGCGISGLTASLSAAEAGARTVALEKSSSFNQRGIHNAALASRMQKAAGIEIEKDQVIYTIMEFGGYRSDQKVVKAWADNCNNVMDWLLDMVEASDMKVILDPTTKEWYFPNYPVIHVFQPEGQESLANMLLSNGQSRGVDYRFETPAVQLIREGKKRVTGVIARSEEGDYFQFNANRAVILCSGDYGNNREMVRKYCLESVANLPCAYNPAVNQGDGHQMGMWVGAAIDEAPHCTVLFDWSAVWRDHNIFNLARQPWLRMDTNGERFMNEDLPWGYECSQILQQQGGLVWAIWDDKWKVEVIKMKSQCCKVMQPPVSLWKDERLDTALANGDVITAPTLDELVQMMDLPAGTAEATIARYNEMARNGRDEDFGKHPDRLTTIEKSPFFAAKIIIRYLVILGGLKINNRMQVLDTEKNIIPGLYAAGNTSGSFFGNHYPTTVPGLTHSRAWTFGRMAGLNAAAEKV